MSASDVEPMDWEQIWCAIYDWVQPTVNVPVIWENQNIPTPSYPYVSLNIITGPNKEGGVDELRTSTDLSRNNGEEIELLTTDQVQFTLSITAHSDRESLATTPSKDPMILASTLQASLGRRSTLKQLTQDADLAIVNWVGPTDVSVAFNGQWHKRYNLDIIFRSSTRCKEYIGYIDKVDIKNDNLNTRIIVNG